MHLIGYYLKKISITTILHLRDVRSFLQRLQWQTVLEGRQVRASFGSQHFSQTVARPPPQTLKTHPKRVQELQIIILPIASHIIPTHTHPSAYVFMMRYIMILYIIKQCPHARVKCWRRQEAFPWFVSFIINYVIFH